SARPVLSAAREAALARRWGGRSVREVLRALISRPAIELESGRYFNHTAAADDRGGVRLFDQAGAGVAGLAASRARRGGENGPGARRPVS
ncbi:MAG: hypothetical protein WBK99_08920, partial [Solirubrobacterales bacterium]